MGLLFKKPEGMRWVDLAIWIDNNIYKDDCDYDTAYMYMWLLAFMLASKQKYFDVQKDYEEFASLMAYNAFSRMTDPSKVKIKSVLNYMKSIMYFRKISFNLQKRQKIIDPQFDEKWDSFSYVERCKENYEASNRDYVFEAVEDTLKNIPHEIRRAIPKVYKSDKLTYENIYTSCLLSMLNRVTLPNIYSQKLADRVEKSPNFNEVKFYKKYLDSDIILWHLPDDMINVVKLVLNKVNQVTINNIKELSNDIKITDAEFNNIMASGFTVGGLNETDN